MKLNTDKLLIAVALLIVLGGGGALYVKARGLRNNNPGNIRFNPANDWVGQVGSDEQGYAKFDKPENGIRAMGILLGNYYTRHGLGDVRSIITRWAPPSDDNPTASYIDHVVDLLNKGRTVKITQNTPIHVPSRLLDLTKAIIRHENGVNPYSDEFISDALALA